MTAFYNLDEAFGYRRYCPCKHCGHTLFPEVATIVHSDGNQSVKLALGGNTLTVGLYSNAVISYEEERQNQTVYSLSGSYLSRTNRSYNLHSLSKQGTDMFPVTVSCNNCHRYNYVLQVMVNLSQGCLVGLVLNSETIVVDDYVKMYTIKTIYTTQKTEMEIRHLHLSQYHEPEAKIEYPMIPLNIEEPMKTVERLKKLTVFL